LAALIGAGVSRASTMPRLERLALEPVDLGVAQPLVRDSALEQVL